MAAEDWDRIKQVFSEALGIPAAQRDAYLDRACVDRPELRRVVSELLSAHYDASTDFLEPGSFVVQGPWMFRTGDCVAGRFNIVRAIARGAMGEVYEVQDERLRLRVALKAIRPQLVGDPETAERFRREVLVTRDIAHDRVCRVFDLIEHRVGAEAGFPDGTIVPCLTMQLLDGETLEDWLRANRPVSPEEALPLIKQIAEALQVLHQHKVVHRDLKPSNVMLVMEEGRRCAMLTDFGLAKPIDASLFETQIAAPGGAPFYMAPELFRGGRPSRASDLYAFGLLIDEMVTRPRAFSAESLHGLMMQKLGDGPSRPSTRAEHLPRHWEQAILRCLAREPGDRFRTPAEVVEALEARPRARVWWRLGVPGAWHVPLRWRVAMFSGVAAVGFAGAGALRDTGQALTPRAVVILPFANLTGRPEYNYLATGTAGELGRRLSRVPDLRVYTQRDATGPIDPLARASYAIGGHIQQAGGNLRITASLTDARTGAVLWSQNFEGTPGESLVLEDTLAADAVGALAKTASTSRGQGVLPMLASLNPFAPALTPDELPATGTTNNEAYDAYLRGRYLFEERTLQSALAAITLLRRSIQLDPNFAAAYATLADVQGVLMDMHYAPHGELIAEAERYARQAVSLDPNLPDAQASLAVVRQAQSQWDEAEQLFKRAIELHPAFARAYRWYGGMVLQFGRFEDSLRLCRRALELDPYDYPSQSAYGHALFHAGRAVEAAAQLEQLIAQKDLLYAHVLLGQVYAHLGAAPSSQQSQFREKAMAESAWLRRQPAPPPAANGKTSATPADYADFIGALAWAGQSGGQQAAPFIARLEAGRQEGRVAASMLAPIYAVSGDTARALDALEELEPQRDRLLMYVNVSPWFVRIRHEPRFRALVGRMHLDR